MQKGSFLLALGLLALSWPAAAQDAVSRFTLLSAYDLDGEAADANQVIEATALVDNGTSVEDANWTIVAQPDVCRLLDLTIADTDMTAGTITVTGVGCLGEARVCSWGTWTAGDDSGVKTLTCTDGRGAYYSSVTSVTTGTMTGESDETFTLGYTSNSAVGWAMYGRMKGTGPSGERGVDPFGSYQVAKLITTSAACSNTVTGVTGADDVYELVSVGDLLMFNVRDSVGNSRSYQRKVTARASADSVTIGGTCVTIPAAGVTFSYKKLFFSTNPADELWIPVSGWKTAGIEWSVDANANTGGVVTSLLCNTSQSPDWPTGQWVEPRDTTRTTNPTTTPSGSTQLPVVESIDLSLAPFQFCKFGLYFGTGDDADAAAEDVNVNVVLSK